MDPKLDIKTILELHRKWRLGEPGGSRANLSGADLNGANLIGAYLDGANLSGASLIGAYLSGATLIGAYLDGADLIRANLSGAYLNGANLIGAYLDGADLNGANLIGAYLDGADLIRANLSGATLIGANLSGANLSGATLIGANLIRANLIGAYLNGANLIGAYLDGANLSGAIGSELALAMASHLPEGPFIGWKKCKDGVIVKLRIPEGSKRSHGASRKCRAEYADVLEVFGADVGISQHDGRTEYRPGKRVYCDKWDDDRWNECSGGIHFFITRLEAENY